MFSNLSIASLLSWFTYCFYLISLATFSQAATAETGTSSDLDIPEEIIETSPTLQKWQQNTPNILEEIYHDPSFRTHFDFGFTVFPSSDSITGIKIGIEDIFLGRTGLTVSGDYQTSFNSDRVSTGADLHYFLFPLGNFVNVAPLIGYRYVQSDDFNIDDINLGLRLILALSRTGAATISVSQSFVSPGGDREVGLFSIAVGYSISSRIRLSTDWELQNSIQDRDNSLSVGLQYLF